MPRIKEALPLGPAHASPYRQIYFVRKADVDVCRRALQHLEHLLLHAPELLAGGVRVVERRPLCDEGRTRDAGAVSCVHLEQALRN